LAGAEKLRVAVRHSGNVRTHESEAPRYVYISITLCLWAFG